MLPRPPSTDSRSRRPALAGTRSLAIALGVGAAGGALTGATQLATLPWGVLGEAQTLVFWSAFGGIGAVAGGLVEIAARLFGRHVRGARFALATVTLAFVVLRLLPANVRERPHVFLLVTDTTRADHLSLHGYERETTPFLEELAPTSVVFRNAVAQAAHTVVSMPCLLASCYPSDHGLANSLTVLPERFELISEILGAAGWKTMGAVTNPHLGAKHGFAQGFDRYDELGPGTSHAVFASRVHERALAIVDSLRGAPPSPPDGGGAGSSAGAGTRREEPPLFAFLFYTDPHAPYIAPDPYPALWAPDWVGAPVVRWSGNAPRPSPDSLANLVAQYDATIRYWDDELRGFFGALEDRGLLENAVWIHTSDHGEEFWDHEEFGHGHDLFEELVHVPLLMSFPSPVRFPPLPRMTREVDEVVSGVDVLPTLLEFLRLPAPEAARGTSALALARGRSDPAPERAVLLEQRLDRAGTVNHLETDVRAIRTREWKYVMVRRHRTRSPGELLFHLAEDPGETRDLSEAEPERVTRLRRILVDRLAEIAAGSESPPPDVLELDEELRERLEALGYLD